VTPDEIRHVQLQRTFRGYDPAEVDRLLEELASNFSELVRERNELRDRVARLEKELEEHTEVQHLMREALVSAQRTADDLMERTQRECDEMLTKARAEAEDIELDALQERERAETEVEKLRTQERELRASYRVLLHGALDRLGDTADEEEEAEPDSSGLLEALAPRRVVTSVEDSSQENGGVDVSEDGGASEPTPPASA
jgi:cell division initiation protein